jgi:hypothetical protein
VEAFDRMRHSTEPTPPRDELFYGRKDIKVWT